MYEAVAITVEPYWNVKTEGKEMHGTLHHNPTRNSTVHFLVFIKHLKNVFASGELSVDSVCAKFAQTADAGKTYQYKFYSLAVNIAVGRVLGGLYYVDR